jgi:hypothetical protein
MQQTMGQCEEDEVAYLVVERNLVLPTDGSPTTNILTFSVGSVCIRRLGLGTLSWSKQTRWQRGC